MLLFGIGAYVLVEAVQRVRHPEYGSGTVKNISEAVAEIQFDGGTKRAIGRAAQWDMSLDLSDLSGVTLYEPAEMVLSARAGTPLAEIKALLADKGQRLAFEPP